MELNDFTVKISILGLPGILCYFVYQRLTGRRTAASFDTFLIIFLFSILSYVLYGFLSACWHYFSDGKFSTTIIDIIFYSKAPISWQLMFYAAFSGVLLAYMLSFGHRFKVLNLVGQKIGATNRYGDEDVWDYFHNLPPSDKNDNWVVVRDHKTGLDYYGYISTWSDPRSKREMIVSDVSIYRDAEYLYDAKHVYFSRNDDDLSIEVLTETPNTEDKDGREEK